MSHNDRLHSMRNGGRVKRSVLSGCWSGERGGEGDGSGLALTRSSSRPAHSQMGCRYRRLANSGRS